MTLERSAGALEKVVLAVIFAFVIVITVAVILAYAHPEHDDPPEHGPLGYALWQLNHSHPHGINEPYDTKPGVDETAHKFLGTTVIAFKAHIRDYECNSGEYSSPYFAIQHTNRYHTYDAAVWSDSYNDRTQTIQLGPNGGVIYDGYVLSNGDFRLYGISTGNLCVSFPDQYRNTHPVNPPVGAFVINGNCFNNTLSINYTSVFGINGTAAYPYASTACILP